VATSTTDTDGKAIFGVRDTRDPNDPLSYWGHQISMHFTVTMSDGTLKPYTDQVTLNWSNP
jgi:hypothetical protein